MDHIDDELYKENITTTVNHISKVDFEIYGLYIT